MNAPHALVVVHVHRDPRVGGQRERQRRRPRAGADDRVGDTRARPLVDERRAERGRRRDRHATPILPRWRPSSWCTASPRTGGAGARSLADARPRATRWSPSTRPATARHRTCELDLWQTVRPARAPTAGPRTSATRWARGWSSTSPSAHPDLVERLVLVSGTAGIEDRGRARGTRRARRGARATLERDGLDAFLERWLAQPLFAALPPSARGRRRPPREHRRRPRVEPAPRRHRHAGAAVGPARRARRCPCSSSRASSTSASPAAAQRMSDADRRERDAPRHRRRRPRVPPRARTRVLDDRSCDWLAQGT